MHFIRKLWGCRPTIKTTVITVVVCLVIGVVLRGFHPGALWGLVLAASFLMYVTIRNWDPDTFEAWNDPLAHSLRHQRDDLYVALRELTEVVEADVDIVAPDIVAVKAQRARDLLDSIRPRTRVKS